MNGTLITKEELDNYTLIPAFVDNSAKWEKELAYAVRLGNEFKGKTQLSIESTSGTLVIETTVWSLAGNYIQIKGGKLIPLKCLIDVKFG